MAAVQLALDEAQALASAGQLEEAAGARRLAALTTAMLPGAAVSSPPGAPGIARVD